MSGSGSDWHLFPKLTLATVSNATVVTGTAVVREGRVAGEERGWLCACVAHFERGSTRLLT